MTKRRTPRKLPKSKLLATIPLEDFEFLRDMAKYKAEDVLICARSDRENGRVSEEYVKIYERQLAHVISITPRVRPSRGKFDNKQKWTH
jgi:hypothetical protein